AWFDLRHPELFAKALSRLVVTLRWLGLPSHPSGFAGHYAQYLLGTDREPLVQPIDNRSFRATLGSLGDTHWTLRATAVHLFRTDSTAEAPSPLGTLVPETRFSVALERAGTAVNRASTGALRLTLKDPAFGFADELY